MHKAPSEAIELKLSWTEVPKSPFMVWVLFVSIGDGRGGRSKVSDADLRGGGRTGDGVTVAAVAAVESKAVVVADAVAHSDILRSHHFSYPLAAAACCSPAAPLPSCARPSTVLALILRLLLYYVNGSDYAGVD